MALFSFFSRLLNIIWCGETRASETRGMREPVLFSGKRCKKTTKKKKRDGRPQIIHETQNKSWPVRKFVYNAFFPDAGTSPCIFRKTFSYYLLNYCPGNKRANWGMVSIGLSARSPAPSSTENDWRPRPQTCHTRARVLFRVSTLIPFVSIFNLYDYKCENRWSSIDLPHPPSVINWRKLKTLRMDRRNEVAVPRIII